MSGVRFDEIMKRALKFLNLVLVAVTISGVIYMCTLAKGLYDFVKLTTETDRRQDESIATHTQQFNKRQEKEEAIDKRDANQDTWIAVLATKSGLTYTIK